MSQNDIKNENDNNEQENFIKTSNIIKGINSVVIPNVEENSNTDVTEETNFAKNVEIGKYQNQPFYHSNDENINLENYNKINNEESINNYQNNYNNDLSRENNFNQINQRNYQINNNSNLIQENKTDINSNFNQSKEMNINNTQINYNNINNNNIIQNQIPNNPPNTSQNPELNFSPSHSSSSKNPSKKKSSYDKNQKTLKDLAFRFPIQDAFSKVEIPFSFQQNLDDPNNDSRFHSYITIKDTPRLYIDISDDQKVDKFKMSSVIDSLRTSNKEKEKKLKLIDDSIMKFKEENNEIASRNNDINKLKQSIQQFNQGNSKYENDIKQKIQEKNNSFIKLKEMYDNIKNEIKNNKLDENSKKEYLIKIKEETNKIQKEYQNNFKYYTNKLMNNNIYPDEYIKQCLQKDLIDFNNYIGARIQMISPKVKELITYIQNAVDASIGKDYEVKLYGSHATGLCLPWSDIDVVLCKKNGDDIDTNLYLPLHELYLYIKERNNFKDIKYIGTTTVPLIKIKTKENIGIQSVDISLQDKSHYGIKCVSLVLSYKEEYEVFLPMILALKNILKQANLNDPYKVRYFFI